MEPSEYWYAWQPVKFRLATRRLTALQRGVYRDLIDEYMESREPLPAHDVALANIARISVDEWCAIKDEILLFFVERDGKLFHEFCNEKLDEQDDLSKKRTKASKKAASKRWEHKQKPKMPDAMPTQYELDATAMRQNAIGQDRIGQEEKENLIKEIPEEKDLEVFWAAYPLKTAKAAARKSFAKAITKTTLENLLAGVKRYAETKPEWQDWAHAATWLNAERWTDEAGVGKGEPATLAFVTADWPDWKKKLGRVIGDGAVASWFADATLEVNSPEPGIAAVSYLHIPKKFHREKIINNFSAELRSVLGITEVRE